MPERPLVEAVDLELHPMEAEVVDQVALEETRRLVRRSSSAKVGMDGEAAEIGNSAALVGAFEVHRPCAPAVHLDDEDAERIGLGLGALHLTADRLRIFRPHRREEGLDILVRDELDEEVHVVEARAPDGDVHAG